MTGFVFIVVLSLLLASAAGWDIASFTIPNYLQIGLVASFVLFAIVAQLPLAMLGGHLLIGFVGLAIGFTLFAFGYIGGGDAKLYACTALWFGLKDFIDYTAVAAVMGGLLSIAIIAMRQLPLPLLLSGQPWIARLHDAKGGIPYGVALAAGAFLVLPQTEIFRIAASV